MHRARQGRCEECMPAGGGAGAGWAPCDKKWAGQRSAVQRPCTQGLLNWSQLLR